MPFAPKAALRHHLLDGLRIALLIWTVIRLFTGPLVRYALGRKQAGASLGRRIRRFCETMGITYVKLGQYLAMRFDVLPAEICQQLANLFDTTQPLSFADIRARIEGELGRPLETIYAEI